MNQIVHNNYEIGMPDNWVDATITVITGPADNEYSPSISIVQQPLKEPTRSETYGRSQANVLQDALAKNGYEVLEEGPAKLGQYDAYRRMFRHVSEDGIPVTQLQFYITRKKEVVIITATHMTANYPQLKDQFEAALEKFAFLD
ncbi:MAG: DcrB-related protein [Pirellulales bacterium]|nr:DcrB-related protein [Pirellulales bacterium]